VLLDKQKGLFTIISVKKKKKKKKKKRSQGENQLGQKLFSSHDAQEGRIRVSYFGRVAHIKVMT
jgi:hypothetical protein